MKIWPWSKFESDARELVFARERVRHEESRADTLMLDNAALNASLRTEKQHSSRLTSLCLVKSTRIVELKREVESLKDTVLELNVKLGEGYDEVHQKLKAEVDAHQKTKAGLRKLVAIAALREGIK